MASVATLSPVKKEPGVLARTTLLPKRKPLVSSVTTRSRFIKPRPNVNVFVNKSSKESSPLPSENVKAFDEVLSQPVETESETILRPAVPKRATAIPTASRARFQRAKPNVGSLLNKSAKDVHSSEEKLKPISDDTKVQVPSNSKLDAPDVSKTESSSEEKCNRDCDSALVPGSRQEFFHENPSGTNCSEVDPDSFNMEKVVDTELTVAESPHTPAKSIDVEIVNNDFSKPISIRPVSGYSTLESHFEKSCNSAMSPRESTNGVPASHDAEKSFTSSRIVPEVTVEKEGYATSVVNKSTEYPTLKSILNSPRKRTATKKAHERRKRVANFSSTPSRSEMTMVDLIYWNPTSSPMKEVKPVVPTEEDLLPPDDPRPPPEEMENCNTGPKVIINDDGEIILDESSLFVRRKDTVDHSKAAVIENDNTTYSSFRNRSFKTWSKKETAKFYKALSLVGTDFALMENIFREDGNGTRTRRELKLKFKREEKTNPKLVHTAMYELQTYDLNILDEDQDDELLDVSQLIDDAPKAQKSPAPGTKITGKRGRKRKSECTEAAANENTSESVPEAEEESIETTDSLSNGYLTENKNDSEPLSRPVWRPERARRAKILSDFVTDIDDLSDTDDHLNNDEEMLPSKKRKKAQVLSEEDDDPIIDGHPAVQRECFGANVMEIIDSPGNENRPEEVPIKRRKKLQVLPKTDEDSEGGVLNHQVSDLMPTSRSGRKIKAKKMFDFVTDPDGLSDADDDVTLIDKMQDLHEVSMDFEEDSAKSLHAAGNESQLCDSAPLKGEFSIILPAEAECEYSNDENIICTINVESSEKLLLPNGHSLAAQSSVVIEKIGLCSSEFVDTTTDNISAKQAVPIDIPSDKLNVDSIMRLPGSETNNSVLGDSVVSEVVITSDQMPRRMRRKIPPNFIRGGKRPPIQKKLLLPSRRTSFTSFTPVEEEQSAILPPIVQSTVLQPEKTYAKQAELKALADVPEYLETVLKSPLSISKKHLLSEPAKSLEMNISRTNSVCASIRSPLSNTPLNVFNFSSDGIPNVSQSFSEMPSNASAMPLSNTSSNVFNFSSDSIPVVSQPSSDMPSNALTPDPKAINVTPENSTDSAPMVILTRTPNNSNMLHLFLYQKS